MQLKTLTKVNVEQLEKMLRHFETYNFIKVIKNRCIELGFLTESIKELVRKEWLLTNVVSSDQPAFLSKTLTTKESLKTAFGDIRNLVNAVPFSLVETRSSVGAEEKILPELTDAVDLVSSQFKNETGTIMRTITFCSPQNSTEIFYQKQREHKIWWRKFSASPGRFVISNTCSNENDQSMTNKIQAEFPWGLETVEIIKHLPNFLAGDKDFEITTSKRKKNIPHLVVSEILLENAAFTFLCDSYEGFNGEDQRDVLKFNRKLAPYKVSVAGTGTSADSVHSLKELSLLLAKQIRKLGFPVLLLPDAHSLSIGQQILRNDAMGIPYTLLLNEKTLKDGTVALRSRDTTLEEQSHVSLIAEYLGTILK